ncbi:MarR family transcriptional regulator [Saccharibacillus sp. CPCC 101409]|uniref:MarR family winged helix-turn-helix transcriptional regulator n=1 Tax=Saccharibacillus sp. CPCC 101409 TaxID=3058041 RepID=UPI002672AA5D|nr:MarR family transcriptional regulator [Saccharibacillus sp. CPCC 101409]MDO3409150.1 MarR family transcriptional regulator [Saccharibacillus sp. CPCC 101409]
MNTKADIELHEIVDSFREVKQLFFQLMSDMSCRFGVTGIQLMTLKALRDRPEIGLGDLAEHMRLGSSTVSGVIDRLVKAELVIRERPDYNRRALVLNLSAKGEEVLEQAYRAYQKHVSGLMDLDAEEMRAMLNVHRKIIKKLEEVRDDNQHEPNCCE